MQLLISQEELSTYKSRQLVLLKCEHCSKTFYKTKNYILHSSRPVNCCSVQCSNKYKSSNTPRINTTCTNCRIPIIRTIASTYKSENLFCSCKCAAIYNNNRHGTGKIKPQKVIKLKLFTKFICIDKCNFCKKSITYNKNDANDSKSGLHFCSKSCRMKYYNLNDLSIRRQNRSKLEIYIEMYLNMINPTLDIIYNDRKTIGKELDIYIPKLKLAFEINGITHYKQIYNNKPLSYTIENDKIKHDLCLSNGIKLITIDTSKMTRFTDIKGDYYCRMICDIINIY